MIEFEATIVRLPGKMAWPVFYVPAEFTDAIGTKGRINIRLVIDGADFSGTLLPSRNGHYHVYNQAMREHCGKELGGTLHVLLEEDQLPREVTLPHDIEEALINRETAMEKYSALPYYMRREAVNYITSAKTQPTREKRITALLDRLMK